MLHQLFIHYTMNESPSRPAAFAPSPEQQRWVRDRHAAIRNADGRWVHFWRVDDIYQEMIDAPYDHHSVGVFSSRVRSFWQCPCVGASFQSLDDAQEWVRSLPMVSRF